MKLSTKLNKRISDFSAAVINFSKKVQDASELVKNFEELVAAGDAAKKFSDKEIEKSLRKFNKVKNYCVNFSEEAADVVDDVESLGSELDQEIANVENSVPAEFSRKFRILARRFSGISNELKDVVSEATSVLNMKPEDVVKVTKPTTEAAESTIPGDGDPADGAETTTQKSDVQTKAESVVNFSYSDYIKFAAKSILKSFAEIIDDVAESAEDANELTDKIEQEPEIPPAEGKTEATPPTEEAPKEVVSSPSDEPKTEETPTEEPKTEETPTEETPTEDKTEESKSEEPPVESTDTTEEDVEKVADEVLEFGEDAIMAGNDAVADELTQKLEDLESKTPGKGEEVMAKLENFSAHYRKFKNFSTTVFDKIKEFAEGACEAAVKKNIDAEDLGSKAENLEKNQPGAGELLTSVLECFGKLINAIKVPNATDCPVTAPEFHPENFCGNIDKFVNDIDVADKKFARELKTKCFALEDAIEDKDPDKVKQFCGELATSLDKSDDAIVKAFGEELVKFSEEYAESTKPAETAEVPVESGVPENIAKADGELNQVLDKLSENGEHLKPEVVAFAKKLCDAYKSMKCFTEEDLEGKLTKVEELKKDLDGQVAPAEPAPEPAPTEVKPVTEEPPAEPKLVEEEETDPSKLPSDSSIQNFSSVPSVKDDPLGHLASLDIR